MEKILVWIANAAYKCGKWCAGMASVYGTYEAPVPEELKKSAK